MNCSTALWAAMTALVTGAIVLWSNPQRLVNRTLFSLSLHVVLWMIAWHFGATAAGPCWSRLAPVLLAALPAHLWLVKDSILMPTLGWRGLLMRTREWIFFMVPLVVWVLVEAFIFLGPWSVRAPVGHAVYLLMLGVAAGVFAVLCVTELQAWRGARRLEVQVLLLGAGSAMGVLLGFDQLSVWLDEPVFFELIPLVVVTIHAGTVWALASTQVLDARHILSVVVERTVLVGAVVLFVWCVQQLASQFMHSGTAYVLSLVTGLWFGSAIRPWLQGFFRQHSRARNLRADVYEVARRELRPELLEDAFVRILKTGTNSAQAALLVSSQSRLAGGGVDFEIASPEMKMLHALRWVTPERLERERSSPHREALRALLLRNDIGLLIANNGPSLCFALAVGVPLTRQPFTHPDIMRLSDVVATMESSLSRARYLRQAQQAEQLATVGMLGASIAHEIRNPLVSIKTFVQLLPKHYGDAGFREKFFRLIGEEVGRIDRLTEQLLDLAAPRIFASKALELHPVVQACIELVTAKAEDKGVCLLTDFQASPDTVLTDPNALKQVLLNLSFNSIQALEQHTSERWIRFATSNASGCIEIAVTDSGPGIAPDAWPRLFQPFQSTKSSGFGLGLAICKDILSSLSANITADPPAEGRGATFRIVLPAATPTASRS